MTRLVPMPATNWEYPTRPQPVRCRRRWPPRRPFRRCGAAAPDGARDPEWLRDSGGLSRVTLFSCVTRCRGGEDRRGKYGEGNDPRYFLGGACDGGYRRNRGGLRNEDLRRCTGGGRWTAPSCDSSATITLWHFRWQANISPRCHRYDNLGGCTFAVPTRNSALKGPNCGASESCQKFAPLHGASRPRSEHGIRSTR
jgi:hypothetical protein